MKVGPDAVCTEVTVACGVELSRADVEGLTAAEFAQRLASLCDTITADLLTNVQLRGWVPRGGW